MDKGLFSRRVSEINEGLTRLDTPIKEQVLTRVGVSEPYFDLHDLRFSRERLLATARATFAQSKEVGPMQMAEVCRHASVAGASIVAWRQRDALKRYCLLEALTLRAHNNLTGYGTPADFSAKVVGLTATTAQTSVSVSVNGSPLAELELNYRILKEDEFKETFKDKFHKSAPYARPIWTMLNTPLIREGLATSRKLSVHPASCQGHFDGYPALPLPLVVGEFVNQAASRLNGPYRCTEIHLQAEALCWANDKLKVGSVPGQHQGATLSFKGYVSRDHKRLIKADVSIAAA